MRACSQYWNFIWDTCIVEVLVQWELFEYLHWGLINFLWTLKPSFWFWEQYSRTCSNSYMAEKGQIKLIFSMLAQYFSWFFFYMAENGHIEVFEYFTLHHILTLYGRKRPYNGGFNRYKSHNLTVLGGVLTCFGTKMGVWNHYMPIFYQKKGGLRVGRGTSKSNRIKFWKVFLNEIEKLVGE